MPTELRRSDRAISRAEALSLLERAEWGVLSTCDAVGNPYGVPVNHVVVDERLYIHSAPKGHKLDNLAANDHVSYCVVLDAEVVPEELSTRFESAIIFGRAELIENSEEKAAALDALVRRLAPTYSGGPAAAMKTFARTAVIRISIEEITGKARRH
jgi:nitroimidazol reductase NimA-like FMN-containing flavoprotein (pyridoxamine 5'-phosphate oxidase superfamily)